MRGKAGSGTHFLDERNGAMHGCCLPVQAVAGESEGRVGHGEYQSTMTHPVAVEHVGPDGEVHAGLARGDFAEFQAHFLRRAIVGPHEPGAGLRQFKFGLAHLRCGSLRIGAEKRTRTSTGLPPLAPEASASANSATSARCCLANPARLPAAGAPRRLEQAGILRFTAPYVNDLPGLRICRPRLNKA